MYWGAIVAKELVSYTGKLWPIKQFYHFDILETQPLDDDIDTQTYEKRYDDFIAIYGNKILEKIQNLK